MHACVLKCEYVYVCVCVRACGGEIKLKVKERVCELVVKVGVCEFVHVCVCA